MRDLAASIKATDRQHAEGAKKLPEDLDRYRVIFDRVSPTVIIECGTWNGMAACWFARTTGATVLTIDNVRRYTDETEALFEEHGVFSYLGDSVSPKMAEWIGLALKPDDVVVVSLDSDHSAAHVQTELEHYAPLVTPGSYIVVEDTICRWLSGEIVAPYVGTPLDAVDAWLPSHPEFTNDIELEDLLPVTMSPGGWLRRA